jgi:type I pantothenate kinase
VTAGAPGGDGRSRSWEAPPPFTTLDRKARDGDADVLAPLTHLVRHHLEGRSGPLLVALAGSVAAGKSTFASALAAALATPDGPIVEVVSTDGFLFTNAELAARGLLARKGFPETYDHALIVDVLGRVARGERDVAVPRYSHQTYDRAGSPQVLHRPDVVIVEGIHALAPPVANLSSVLVYLDAAEDDLRTWFVARFTALVAAAADDPESFFAAWTGMSDDDVRHLAEAVWEQVNLVNLVEHILPTRWRADVVLRKGADHAVTHVATRIR